jgi:hypothetical protein
MGFADRRFAMGNRLVAPALLALFVLTASPAGAQLQSPPRFEIGAHGGAMVFAAGDGAFLLNGGPRVTLNINRRDAVELLADFLVRTEHSGAFGLYLIQYKRVLREGDRRRRTIFVTGSTAGTFRYHRRREWREDRADGATIIHPAYTRAQVESPILIGSGVGFERVGRYAAFRAEVGALVPLRSLSAVGIRGVLGVSIPLGGRNVAIP